MSDECKRVAELLGWLNTGHDRYGDYCIINGSERPFGELHPPCWPFAGAVLEELARRGLEPHLYRVNDAWDFDIFSALDDGRTQHLVAGASEGDAPTAIIRAALSALEAK